MKKFFMYIILTGLTTLYNFAQDDDEFKTILGGKEVGGYGSIALGYSMIDSSNALNFSARGGIILNHFLTMGIGGTGFITEYQEDPFLNKKAGLTGGYGGVFLEFILVGNSPIHLSVPLLVGVGGVAYSSWSNEGTDYQSENYIEDACSFLVFEPGIELEFNVMRFVRIAAYFNYRYTSNLDLTTPNTTGQRIQLVKSDALNTYNTGLIFKFGKF